MLDFIEKIFSVLCGNILHDGLHSEDSLQGNILYAELYSKNPYRPLRQYFI